MLIHPHRGGASWAFLTLTLKTESSSRRKRKRRCGIFLWWVVRRGGGSRWFGLWERAAGWGLCCDSGCDLWAWEAGQSEESLPNQPSWPLTINLERGNIDSCFKLQQRLMSEPSHEILRLSRSGEQSDHEDAQNVFFISHHHPPAYCNALFSYWGERSPGQQLK